MEKKTDKIKSPMGISQWREYGEKYGYWDYFQNQNYNKTDREISKLLSEHANTPLDQRGDGWDWLLKLRKRIKNI